MKKKLSFLAITAIVSMTACSVTFAGRPLYNGSSGDDVYELQQLLAAYGYFYDEPTGYFGDMTELAVTEFQLDYGLVADGIAGQDTCAYLGLTTSEESYDSSDYSGDYYISGPLYAGMEGSEVYALQELLIAYGYLYGEATGFFGEATQDAVISFQNDYGLEADGIVGDGTISALTGTSSGSSYDSSYYQDYAAAVLDAVRRTPATGAGYCAAWVTQVLQNAGVLTYNINNLRPTYYSYASTSGLADSWYADSTGFNANDYWAYVCYSSDPDDLAPGMVVATRSSFTYLGRQFGHVGIYIGDGLVTSSIGYLETISLDEWNRRYNNTALGSSIAWGYLPA